MNSSLKYLATLLIFLFFINSASSQRFNPCGTESYRSEWLKSYQKSPENYQVKGGILYVPTSITTVGRDNGNGRMLETRALITFCQMQEDFEGTNMEFYLVEPVKSLSRDDYYEHETVLDGAQMMFDNNTANVMNNYIVDNPAGNCGYNLPYAGIALATDCIQPGDHTWSHEIGHHLSLPHPFLGWEGGVAHDFSVTHNYNDPAPEFVTYDYTYFKDTLILDTTIIDTAYVEKMDGSNCHFAADGFCDTAPDYLASRWNCNQSMGQSIVEQTDPDGNKFYSDASLFMSYSFDECANRFTEEQIAAMRANLVDEKPHYVAQVPGVKPPIESPANLISPNEGAVVAKDIINLSWEEVDDADFYLFQLGVESSNTVILFDTMVTTPSLVLNDLDSRDYYWRIKAMHGFDYCNAPWSESRLMVVGDFSTSVEDVAVDNRISIYPNPLGHGDVATLNVSTITSSETHVNWTILNTTGEVVCKGNGTQIGCHSLVPEALYFVEVFEGNTRLGVEKLLLY